MWRLVATQRDNFVFQCGVCGVSGVCVVFVCVCVCVCVCGVHCGVYSFTGEPRVCEPFEDRSSCRSAEEDRGH